MADIVGNAELDVESSLEVLDFNYIYSEENFKLVRKYFPQGYQLNVHYEILIKILAGYLTEIKPHIENFNDLVNVDICPEKFLPFLGALIGYEYDYNKSSRSNRFIIKYLLEAYRRRGTEEALKLVTRIAKIDESFDDVTKEEKYYEYIFDPNISEDENQLFLPRRWMFRWGSNIQGFYSSEYSTIYAYPSATAVPVDELPGNAPICWYYNDAVFDIFAPEITFLLRELMKWVIPAGMRSYWTMVYYLHTLLFNQYTQVYDTDLQVFTGEDYRLVFFHYRKSDTIAWQVVGVYEEVTPSELFTTTYSFDKLVENLSPNTVYEYRIGIAYSESDDKDRIVNKYVYGDIETFVTPAYGDVEVEVISDIDYGAEVAET